VLRQQEDIHPPDDPVGGGFQVVQEYFGDGLIRQPDALPAQQSPSQQRQGGTVAAVRPAQSVLHLPGRHIGLQHPQQQHRCCAHRQLPGAGRCLGKAQDRLSLALGAYLHGQGRQRVQQLEGRLCAPPSAGAAVGQQVIQKPLLPARTVLQQGVHHEFQRIADPASVLGHQLVIRENDLLQPQLPLAHIRHRAQRPAVHGPLLHIARVEIGDDGPHE